MPEEKLARKVKSTFTNSMNINYDVIFFAIPLVDFKAEALQTLCQHAEEDLIDILALCLNNGIDGFLDKIAEGYGFIKGAENE